MSATILASLMRSDGGRPKGEYPRQDYLFGHGTRTIVPVTGGPASISGNRISLW
jgi:hypothetical protein